jgi:hypothetical protein
MTTADFFKQRNRGPFHLHILPPNILELEEYQALKKACPPLPI